MRINADLAFKMIIAIMDADPTGTTPTSAVTDDTLIIKYRNAIGTVHLMARGNTDNSVSVTISMSGGYFYAPTDSNPVVNYGDGGFWADKIFDEIVAAANACRR